MCTNYTCTFVAVLECSQNMETFGQIRLNRPQRLVQLCFTTPFFCYCLHSSFATVYLLVRFEIVIMHVCSNRNRYQNRGNNGPRRRPPYRGQQNRQNRGQQNRMQQNRMQPNRMQQNRRSYSKATTNKPPRRYYRTSWCSMHCVYVCVCVLWLLAWS